MSSNSYYMYVKVSTYHNYVNAYSRGSPHTSQISYLLLYPSLWLLVPGLSSHFLPLLPLQPAFNVSSGWQYLWEVATRFCKLQEPLLILQYNVHVCVYACNTHLFWPINWCFFTCMCACVHMIVFGIVHYISVVGRICKVQCNVG